MTAVRDLNPETGMTFEAFYCDGKPSGRVPACHEKIEADDLYGIHEAFKKFGKPAGWQHWHGRHICPACYGSGFGRGFRDDAFDPPMVLMHNGKKLRGSTFIDRRREELGFGHPYNDRPGRREL